MRPILYRCNTFCDEKERAYSPTDNTDFVILSFLTMLVKYFLDNDPLIYYIQKLPESFQSIRMAWKKKNKNKI